MSNHTFLILAVFLVTSQCGEPFDISDDTRVEVSGKVVDGEGNPIRDIFVSTEVETYTLGFDITDLDGNFKFTSLQSHSSGFEIFINWNNPKYTSVYYIDQASKRVKNAYNLGKIVLRRTATFYLQIQKTSTTNDTLKWNLTYSERSCRYVWENDVLAEYSSCYENTVNYGEENPSSPHFQGNFPTLLNASVQFSYSINNGAEQTKTLNITQENQSYVFEY